MGKVIQAQNVLCSPLFNQETRSFFDILYQTPVQVSSGIRGYDPQKVGIVQWETNFLQTSDLVVFGENYAHVPLKIKKFPLPTSLNLLGSQNLFTPPKWQALATGYDVSTSVEENFSLLTPMLCPPLNPEKNNLALQPYDYQWTGIHSLVTHENYLLADEMGTGKSVQTSIALKILFQKGLVLKALVVSPISVLRVWSEHLTKLCPELKIITLRGSKEERLNNWTKNAHLYLASYESLVNDYRSNDLASSYKDMFDLIILDEAQAIKDPSSKRSRTIKKIPARYRWALTGTPLENRVDDVISLFNFIKPGYFNPLEAMMTTKIKEKIAPYMLRRLKRDVLKQLPPKTREEIWLDLDEKQAAAYAAALNQEQENISNLGEKVTKTHIFGAIIRLKQICNFAPSNLISPKSKALLDILENLEDGRKLIVFTHFIKQGLLKIEHNTKQLYPTCVLSGEQNEKERNEVVDQFRNDSQNKILIASLKVGGVGLTLTEASYVVHFDHWWNPAIMRQAEDRVHRPGQKAKNINIYEFWMENTVERGIYNILYQKGLLAEDVIDSLADTNLEQKISKEEWLKILFADRKPSSKPI